MDYLAYKNGIVLWHQKLALLSVSNDFTEFKYSARQRNKSFTLQHLHLFMTNHILSFVFLLNTVHKILMYNLTIVLSQFVFSLLYSFFLFWLIHTPSSLSTTPFLCFWWMTSQSKFESRDLQFLLATVASVSTLSGNNCLL